MAKKSNLPPVEDAKSLYLRLLNYSKRYWVAFVVSVFALSIYSATNTGFLAVIKKVTDEGFVNKDPSQKFYLPLMMFGLLLTRALAGFFSGFAMRWVARHVVEDLRLETFKKLMRFPVSFYDGQSVGVVTSKVTYDTEQMSKTATSVSMTAVRDTLTIIGMIAYMLYLDWQLTLIFAVVAPLMVFYLRRMTPKLRSASKQTQQMMGEMT